jgi:NADH dehydrogenase (ubiquinone) 1 alpha subcomplex subunit 8
MEDNDEILESSSGLMAAAKYLGSFCEDVNTNFLKCKAEDNNPNHCLEQGKLVSQCTQNV